MKALTNIQQERERKTKDLSELWISLMCFQILDRNAMKPRQVAECFGDCIDWMEEMVNPNKQDRLTMDEIREFLLKEYKIIIHKNKNGVSIEYLGGDEEDE